MTNGLRCSNGSCLLLQKRSWSRQNGDLTGTMYISMYFPEQNWCSKKFYAISWDNGAILEKYYLIIKEYIAV